jgi:hypothetical protein
LAFAQLMRSCFRWSCAISAICFCFAILYEFIPIPFALMHNTIIILWGTGLFNSVATGDICIAPKNPPAGKSRRVWMFTCIPEASSGNVHNSQNSLPQVLRDHRSEYNRPAFSSQAGSHPHAGRWHLFPRPGSFCRCRRA